MCIRLTIMAPQLSIKDKSDLNVCLKHFLHCAYPCDSQERSVHKFSLQLYDIVKETGVEN